jgi:succinate dehydrogenase hydrophobic anchor subunit
MSVNFGTKRIVVGAHYGLRDWLAQRITAGLMALFTLLVLAQVVFSVGRRARHPHGLHQAVRVASGAANLLHRLAPGLRGLGHPGLVAPLMPRHFQD